MFEEYKDKLLNPVEVKKIRNFVESGKATQEQKDALLDIMQKDIRAKAHIDYKIYSEAYIKITDKQGNQIRFRHNEIQKKINDTVKELHKKNIPVRIIVLKARQEGVSTNEQGRMIFNTTTKSNRNGLIVAHMAKSTQAIFDKAKYMYNNLTPDIKPLEKASNATELIFDRPTGYKGKEKGLNSKIVIQTAGTTSIGRSETYHYVHLSEFAFWESPEGKNPIKQLNGILESVPLSPDTEVVIESTANGVNDFKELWDMADAGVNEWVPLFFAWHDLKEYQKECTEEEFNRKFNTLDLKLQKYLLSIQKTYNLTKEQIYWYIWKLQNNCSNDHNMMKQENPSFPEEAFLTSGTPVFDTEKINNHITNLRIKYKKNPPKKGRFAFEWNDPDTCDFIKEKSIKWVDDPYGFITIYEDRQEGYPYVIGGDTKGEGKDKYAATVINNVSGKRAAVVHGQWTHSKPYTHQVYCLGMYYNLALIGIETNFNTGPIEELERLHYPRQYTRKKYDSFTGEYKNSHGFKTDGNSRPLIIDKEIHLIESNIDLFTDVDMLLEALTFVYDKDGRPDAQSGKHDDILMSDMIANEIRSQQSFEVDMGIVREEKGTFDEDTEDYRGESESPFD